jgi:hypothetical protein
VLERAERFDRQQRGLPVVVEVEADGHRIPQWCTRTGAVRLARAVD